MITRIQPDRDRAGAWIDVHHDQPLTLEELDEYTALAITATRPVTPATLEPAARRRLVNADPCICEKGPRSTRYGLCVDCGGVAGDVGEISRCAGCGAQIIWAYTELGRRMPVDADPSPTGNVELHRIGGGYDVGAKVLGAAELEHARGAGSRLRTSHHATCPKADEFRHGRERRRSSSRRTAGQPPGRRP